MQLSSGSGIFLASGIFLNRREITLLLHQPDCVGADKPLPLSEAGKMAFDQVENQLICPGFVVENATGARKAYDGVDAYDHVAEKRGDRICDGLNGGNGRQGAGAPQSTLGQFFS